MKESVNGSKITMVLNIVVIIFTLLVIIMGLSCLAEAERARAELSDVRQALEELRSSTPLDQFWTQKALQKVRTGASPGEDVKTVFLTCKREGDSGGELILVTSDEEYRSLKLSSDGKAVSELEGEMEKYLQENGGELIVLISRDRFDAEDLARIESALGERIERFQG